MLFKMDKKHDVAEFLALNIYLYPCCTTGNFRDCKVEPFEIVSIVVCPAYECITIHLQMGSEHLSV